MDDPSYIELRTSKDHWTLIRRILKSFKWYIYMSNNSRVKRDGINQNEWDLAMERELLYLISYWTFEVIVIQRLGK